jgi:hypothetical protein
MARDLKVFLYG